MSATTKDVARLAEVSMATVSRYVNGYALTEQNRIKIEHAIDELDFRINPIAKTLRTNRSMTVAVLVPSLANIFSMTIIESIERHLDAHDYSIIVCDSRNEVTREKAKLEFVRDKYVDGIILMPTGNTGGHVAEVLGESIPVVLVDRLVSELVADAVVVDNTSAVYHAVEQLIVQGHRLIGIIAGPVPLYTAEERLEGYRRVMQDYGLPVEDDLVQYGDYTRDTGCSLMKRFMLQERPPTAVFVSNYEMTIGAIERLNELDVAVPSQLSVIGFDHLDLSSVVRPRLAVVAQPREEIGRKAAELLRTRMNGDKTGFPSLVRLKTQFMPGASITTPSSR